jgi:hypothetical protein
LAKDATFMAGNENKTMDTRTKHHLLSFFIGWLLLCSLAACSSVNTSGNVNPSPAQATSTPIITPTPHLPATSTSCPAAGTARAMVTGPMVLGSDPTIVYSVNASSAGSLKRYDVKTGQTTEILSLPGASIGNAQISADGKWVLFTNGSMLQVVRMDGQGLQTLYCDANSSNFQWSTNQNLIAFESRSDTTDAIKLLHVTDGTIENVLPQASPYNLRTWLDNTRLYLTRSDTDVPPDALAILDLNRGQNQTVSNLISVVKPEPGSFQDFDSSYNGTQVFVAHSPCTYSCSGPGDITVEPTLGGTTHTIYTSTAYSVKQVRAVTDNFLLFRVSNYGFPNQNSGDLSHNGLWVIHTDGTGLTRLTTDSDKLYTYLNNASQYPWSNVSRDSSMYAIEQQTCQKSGSPVMLLFGSLNGGAPTLFADMADGTPLSIAGWTTI